MRNVFRIMLCVLIFVMCAVSVNAATVNINLNPPSIIYPAHDDIVRTARPTISWSVPDNVSDYMGYQVQIATDSNFTNIIYNREIDEKTTYHRVDTELTKGISIYVRVRLKTYDDQWTRWSNEGQAVSPVVKRSFVSKSGDTMNGDFTLNGSLQLNNYKAAHTGDDVGEYLGSGTSINVPDGYDEYIVRFKGSMSSSALVRVNWNLLSNYRFSTSNKNGYIWNNVVSNGWTFTNSNITGVTGTLIIRRFSGMLSIQSDLIAENSGNPDHYLTFGYNTTISTVTNITFSGFTGNAVVYGKKYRW